MVNRNVAIQRKTRKKKAARKGNGAAQPEPTAKRSRAAAALEAGIKQAYSIGVREALQQVATQYGMPIKVQGKGGAVETIEPEPAPDQAERDARSARYDARARRQRAFEAEVAAEGDNGDGLREALGSHIFATYDDGDDTLLMNLLQSLADNLEILGDGVREGTLGQSHALDRQLWRLEQRARFGLLVAGRNNNADEDADEAAVRNALLSQAVPPEEAEQQAASILTEAWEAVKGELQAE